MERLNYIDIAKGLGIIFVVMGHVTHDYLLRQYFYNFHMPLFFFISGLLLSTKLDVSAHLKRRVKSIIVPYIVFFLLTYLYWFLVECRYRGADLDSGEQFFSLFRGAGMDFNGPLWFLPCLFVVDTISYTFIKRFDNWMYIFAFVLFAFVLGIVLQENIVFDLPWGIKPAMYGIVFYCIGYLSKQVIGHFQTKYGLILLICALCIAIQVLNLDKVFGSMSNASIGFMGLAFIGILLTFELSFLIKKSRFLEFIGGGSLIILVLHGQLERIVIFTISKLGHLDVECIRSGYVLSIAVSMLTIVMICPVISLWNNTINQWIRKK